MKAIWIVVADAARARIFTADSPIGELRETLMLEHSESREPGRELQEDKPGRGSDRNGGGRHAVGNEQNLKDHEAWLFAKMLAERLTTGLNNHEYSRVLICAPPRFLGLLRQVLPANVREQVSEEINKDLTHLERPEEVRAHLPFRL